MRHTTHTESHKIPWAKTRILVYSRDESLRFMVRQTFRKLGVRDVLVIADIAATATVMAHGPDLGILDSGDGQPDPTVARDALTNDALDCLEKIRAIDPHMPVLMLLASTDKDLLARALALGIEDVAPKRVSGHELTLRAVAMLKDPRRIAKPAPPPKAAPTAPAPGSSASSPKANTEPNPSGSTPSFGAGTFGSGGLSPSALRQQTGSISGGTLPDLDPLPVSEAKKGGFLDMEDAPPVANGGAASRLDGADFAPAARLSPTSGDSPTSPSTEDPPVPVKKGRVKRKPKPPDEQQQDAESAQQWDDELKKSGHKRRKKGQDSAALDVDAIAADHALWLETHGREGKRANFEAKDLAATGLSGLDLPNAAFRNADLSDADLSNSRLDGADFRFAVLGAANLQGADIMVAQLRHADLRLSNLQGANLRGADMSGSKLRGAKMDGANFQSVILVGADLSEADLSKVDNLTQSQITKAICDESTKLPPGLRRPNSDADLV